MYKLSKQIICLILPLVVIYSPFGAASDVDFSDKTIEWIVPFRTNGGSDTWARFTAPFLSKHLPGNPTIIVKNVPGGGSTKAANRYSQKTNPDGLSLFGTSVSTHIPFLLGDSRVKYDYGNWRVLLVYPNGGVVYTSSKFGIKDVSDIARLRGKKLLYGSQGTTSFDLVLLLGFELLGLDVTPIFGIRGREAGRLAFERGNTNIDFQTSSAYIKNILPMVEAGSAIPLFTLGALDQDGRMVRDPQFPDLPTIKEVYQSLNGHPPKGISWDSWTTFNTVGSAAQKLLVVPLSTPDKIVKTYHKAIEAMFQDPEYQAQKDAVLGSYKQVTGEAATRLYNLSTKIPDKRKEWMREWLRNKYKLNI
jgi:tripartite-type tricarboxylate transporter receptor subunit TctC